VDSTEDAHAATGIASWRPDAVESALPAGPGSSRSPRLAWLAVLLCAAWLVPLGLHLLRLDVVQPVLLLLAVASILRAGTNVVDRFMLAAGMLAGAVLSLGLLFSVWPWGLQPVTAGGTCFSLVVLTGWLARRPPCLPRRLLGSDVVVLGSGIFAFWAAYAPIAGLSLAKRLAFSTIASDRFRQFALFDTIHRLGGYAFLHQSQARLSVPTPTEVVYPSGLHFLFALFDTFLRSATDPGAALPEFNRYFIYVLAAYAFLIMAIVWAARWIAGPRLAGWRRFVICSAVAALMISAPWVNMVAFGLDSDILGLAFFALAVAVTVRPPRVVQEQVLIACALLIAVAYTYNIYAVTLGLGMGAAGIVYRRRLRRHWRFAVVTIVVGCAIACYPSVLSLASGFNAQAQAMATTGWVVPLPVPLVAGLALVIVATMTSAVSRRLPVWQAMTAQLLASATVIGAFAVYQVSEMGRTSYYFNKVMMVGYVVCVIGLGVLGGFLRPLHAHARRDGRPSRLREARLAVAVGVVAMSVATLFQSGLSSASPRVWVRSGLAKWSAGKVTAFTGPSLIALTDVGLLGDGVPTLVFVGNMPTDMWDNYYAAAVNRDFGAMNGEFGAIHAAFVRGLRAHMRVGAQELLAAEMAIRVSSFPLRVIVADPVLARNVRAMLARNPDVKATVLVVRTLRR
jgi:hypothetical protein